MSTHDVTIVGAGPVGLVTALGLGQAGVGVTVLESAPSVVRAPQSTLFHWSIMSELDHLGLLEEARAVGLEQRSWSLQIVESGEELVFDLSVLGDEVEHPFTLHLAQNELSRIVHAHLRALPNVRVERGTSACSVVQDATGCTVGAVGPEGERDYRSSWVIAADGTHSVVRRKLGLAFHGMTWPERFVVADLDLDLSMLGYRSSVARVAPPGSALIAQLASPGPWRYTYAESRILPDDSVGQRMSGVLRAALPDSVDPGVREWASFRMHERVADRFRVGRVLLLGDSAHVTNPTSGYGVACGFYDSAALVEALGAVILDGACDDVLDRYSTERRRVFTEIASPVSSEQKQLVFDVGEPARKAADLERYRRIVNDRDRMRRFMMTGRELRSGSLLSAGPTA
ncbi:FAD-dependent oxidoreductase [Nocardioides acrostichi]|uniref:FAD-dependent monooxygenase n=1 Tax=Nocardioides acrostichi TaxID=2784339 RepID=A0A930V2T6_9ACTN|nr:FAD-dependent monooxygenase [Nocardioides acrostichi]MBF4162720.1 FAD-dependent monooxygenase [Nocardioides acrostichi]